MLTQQQREDFSKALTFWNCGDENNEIAVLVEPEDVVATRDALADFKSGAALTAKRYTIEKTPRGDLHKWEGVQARKGARRGDLFVMDFGDVRAAWFEGEE